MLTPEFADPDERLKIWNRHIEQDLSTILMESVWILFGLAGLDCGIIKREKTLLPCFADPVASGLDPKARTDYFTYSVLWVFGVYEVVRTLHQRLKNPKLPDCNLCVRVDQLKLKLERVRVPLAKLERPRRSPGDTGLTLHGTHFERGIGWEVAPNCFISRRELSDDFLEILLNWKVLIAQPASQ